jgi:hypothetical protein
MQHVIIYKEEGRYAGWPANYGIWSWDDEIVLGFTTGYHQADNRFHARDKSQPWASIQARSTDGGVTWQLGPLPAKTPGNKGVSADEHMEPHLWIANDLQGEDAPAPCPGDVDFSDPNFALMCARSNLGAGALSWFYLSTNRCKSWEGPYQLPLMGQSGIAARSDYQVTGSKECMLFLTAAKEDGDEGKIFCARTQDGGQTFQFVSWIGRGSTEGYRIMPASVRLSDSHLLVAIRCREDVKRMDSHNWIDIFESFDNGTTWTYKSRPVSDTGKGGNPPTFRKLQDGRLCMTYGYRNAPFNICAKLSTDEGSTWGNEIILRTGGGSHDIGYPRTVQRADGMMVTAYYFNERLGGECHIAATIWKP